jgi:hypothetical protein
VNVLLALGLSAAPGVADDYHWTGFCDGQWYTVCTDDPPVYCDPNDTMYWHYNNWGHVTCGNDPGPPFPGDLDNVYLTGDTVFVDANASAGFLALDATSHLQIGGEFQTRTFTLTGPNLMNAGTITVDYDHNYSALLYFANTATLGGGGEVVLNDVSANLDNFGGTMLTNTADHIIHGYGWILADLVNNGTVSADFTGQTLYYQDNHTVNNGTMEATGGGVLYLGDTDVDTTITQSAQGQLRGDGGQVWLIANTTVSGGTLASANGGGIYNYWNGTLNDVTIADGAMVGLRGSGGSAALTLTGSETTNDGTIVVNYDQQYGTTLMVGEDLALEGSGEVVLDALNAHLDTAEGATLTHGADHTIRGYGWLWADLVNNGTVSADVSGETLWYQDNHTTNNGTIEATGGGYLNLGDTGLDTTVTQSAQGQLLADGGQVWLYNDATVSGGTLASANGGGIYNYVNNTLSEVTIAEGAWLGLCGGGGSPTLTLTGSEITNDGTIIVNYNQAYGAVLGVADDLTLAGSGEVLLNQPHSYARIYVAGGLTLTHAAGHTIRGHGQIHAAMLNNGTVRADVADWDNRLYIYPQAPGITNNGKFELVAGCCMELYDAALFTQTGGETIANGYLVVYGGPLDIQGGRLTGDDTVAGAVSNAGGSVEPGSSAGDLGIYEDYTQGSSARLRIELGGPTPGVEYDVLDVGGTANLDGELRVDPINDYVPDVGTEFTVLTAGSVNGEFAEVTGPGQYTVTYNADNVTLTVDVPPIPGDLDGDGQVGHSDLGILLSDWNCTGGGCAGDCDGDGDTDHADLGVLLAHWGQGCP